MARLYSTGSYEHVRYELTVDVPQGASAKTAFVGMEKLLQQLAPESKHAVHSRLDCERQARRVDDMRKDLQKLGPEEFHRRQGHFEGTPEEYIGRCFQSALESATARKNYEAKAAKARELLDQLGGIEEWKDCKLDWESQWNED